MRPEELEKLATLVADRLGSRPCRCCDGSGATSTDERQLQLKGDLEALSVAFSARDRVAAEVRAEIAEHGFVAAGHEPDEPGGIRPPDYGPHGPTDADIDREIRDILKKIERLRNPQGEEEFERKLPWRVQINVALLISILLELLKLILKLRRRMRPEG